MPRTAEIGGLGGGDTARRNVGEGGLRRWGRRVGGGGSPAWSEAIAGAVRFGVGLSGRVVTRMRRLAGRRTVVVMRIGPRFFGGDVDDGMPGGAVVLTLTHGGGLQALRDHETRDQQNSRSRWESASPIEPGHHVPILESSYRLSNPAMARKASLRQFVDREFQCAPRVYSS